MPTRVTQFWEPDYRLEGHRQAARGFSYEAYVPDEIAGWELPVPLALAEALEQARQAVAALQEGPNLAGVEALSRHLLRAESIGSSHIEGLRISQRRLMRALLDPDSEGETARAVIGNVQAMEAAIRFGESAEPFEMEAIKAIHRTLFVGTQAATMGGQVRTTQNWIGGDDHSPYRAEFIPPPASELERLLTDLCAFMRRDNLPAILQAAIVHAQFETIHPFADGNGRVGRALIHVVLRRRGAAPRVVPPISLVLAANANRYVEGLTAYRAENAVRWCTFFTRTMQAAASHAAKLHEALNELQASWRSRLGQPRRHSAAEKLIQGLPAQPVIDIHAATAITGGSDEGARKALNDMASAGILSPVVVGKKKNRMWEARELLGLVDGFEWSLASLTQAGEVNGYSQLNSTSKI